MPDEPEGSQTMCSSVEHLVVFCIMQGRPQYLLPMESWRKQRGTEVTPGQTSVGQSESASHFETQILRDVGSAQGNSASL